MGQTVQQSAQATALQQAAEMEAAYPNDSADYNEDYTNEVVELRDAFIIKGYDPVDALGERLSTWLRTVISTFREVESESAKAKRSRR